MGGFSLTHLLVLALILLIFFGPSRLPQLGQSIGKALRGFKQGLNEIDADVKDVTDNQQISQNQNQNQNVNSQKVENPDGQKKS